MAESYRRRRRVQERDARARVRIRLRDGGESRRMADAVLRSMLPAPREVSRWVFVAPDQLHASLGALRSADPGRTGVLLVESREWLSRRPYHRMRVALILLNMRHFALELARAGFAVRYERVDGPMMEAVRAFAAMHGPLDATECAEREMRQEFAPLLQQGLLKLVPHDGFITARRDFDGCRRGGQWSMDAFYRAFRTRTGA
jgi:deoxyribodipyrimidine photolyase-related protein